MCVLYTLACIIHGDDAVTTHFNHGVLEEAGTLFCFRASWVRTSTAAMEYVWCLDDKMAVA